MKMTAACEPKKYNSNQVAVSVLLIGDNDVVIRTSDLLWDTLPRCGEVRVVKLVPLSAVPFVDPNPYQLLFFHLSNTNTPGELEALHDLREKNRQRSCKTVLVVPEAGPDVPDSAADFVLTQPITVEMVEEVLHRCSFLSEQSQNVSSASACPDTVVEQKPEPEETDQQAKPGTPAQERVEGAASPSEDLLEGPSAELTNEDLQAFLHSKKEQKRRMQIRACCERLRELLPFKSRTDTASTLELTVKYMAYIRQRLPQDVLDKIVKALEENGPETWYKQTKNPKKRMACVARNRPIDILTSEPTDASFADDFIAAHVLGRHIQPKVQGLHPAGSFPPAVPMNQPFGLPPDLRSTSAPGVPLGRASAPLRRRFVTSEAYAEPAAMDCSYAPQLFWKQACGPVSSAMVNQGFVPQMVHNPSVPHAVLVEESSLLPVPTLMVGPEVLSPVGLDSGYPPPALPVMMNQAFAPLGPLSDPCPPKVTANLPPTCAATAPGGVSDYRPPATTTPWEDRLLTEILYDSAPSLPSLSPAHGCVRVDNPAQSSAPQPPSSSSSSSSLSGPPQWDFGCESGAGYPLQPRLLESLPPHPVPHHIPAHSAPDPGSTHQLLGGVSTTKLHTQPHAGATDFQRNENWGNASS